MQALAEQLEHALQATNGFDAARKLQPDATIKSRARIALDMIGKLYLIEREHDYLSHLFAELPYH